MVAATKPLLVGENQAPSLLTVEEYFALPERRPEHEYEEGILQGYLAVARVAAGSAFHPQLFPGMAIILAGLLGETVES